MKILPAIPTRSICESLGTLAHRLSHFHKGNLLFATFSSLTSMKKLLTCYEFEFLVINWNRTTCYQNSSLFFLFEVFLYCWRKPVIFSHWRKPVIFSHSFWWMWYFSFFFHILMSLFEAWYEWLNGRVIATGSTFRVNN